MRVKALARGIDESSTWQLNMNGAFPGATAVTTVNQYYDDGDGNYTNDTLHNFDGLWISTGGVAMPVLLSTLDALQSGDSKSGTANVVGGSTYVEGDYSIVRIVFKDSGVAPGTYSSAPYTPELRVAPSKGSVYVYNLWQKKGDALYSNGYPKGGFAVPSAFPWALEGKSMSSVYSGWTAWTKWMAPTATGNAPTPAWYSQAPLGNYFNRAQFK
jgi:hypothetical protein